MQKIQRCGVNKLSAFMVAKSKYPVFKEEIFIN